MYAIIDYKYQDDTCHYGVCLDLIKPTIRGLPYASAYVQLLRAKHLNHILILLRPFDPEDLREPLSEDLLLELKWQEEMDLQTMKEVNQIEIAKTDHFLGRFLHLQIRDLICLYLL
jgi:hypothetical protein